MRSINHQARYDDDLNNWVKKEEHLFLIGLTDFGQEFIGTISSISELPPLGQLLAKGAIYCVLESDKASTEIFLPLGGKVVAINQKIIDQPSLINTDCYETGWIIKVKDTNAIEWNDLQTAEEYAIAISSFFNK